MKKQLLPIIACAATLLPFSQAKAVELPFSKANATQPAQPAVVFHGDFQIGQTFTFKVSKRTSTNSVLGVVYLNAQVPSDTPKFEEGQNVTFTIGADGMLTAPGVTIPFVRAQKWNTGLKENFYTSDASTNVAVVRKSTTNQPVNAVLSFRRKIILNLSAGWNTTNYYLN